ncbi:MAG: hypothetical protein LBE35_09920 [Clostridiales bacterium]|jgi:hypothetical protein|nr:hypothetical protein [Clostridiales bacterium]
MEQLLDIRQNLINFYKKFELAINYMLKFVAALVVFMRVGSIGMYREEFAVLFNGATGAAFILLVSLIFTVSPSTVALLLVAVVIALQLSLAAEVAIFVFLLLVLIVVFYARLAPRQSMLILAIIFGFYFHIPYAVVLFAGLYVGLAAIIPVIIGTAVWTMLGPFIDLARAAPTLEMQEFDLFEIPAAFFEIFGQIFEILTTNLSWILIGFVFAMMILAVHLISLLAINHAKDIALGIGAAIGLICMIMVQVVAAVNLSILSIFLGSIISFGIVWVIKFFDKVVDYKRVERVKFEDEENVYYVRIVPKIGATAAKPAPEPEPEEEDDIYPRPIPNRRPR